MADTKVSALNANVAAAAADLLYIVDAGTTSEKITFANFEGSLTHDNVVAGTIASHDTTGTGANLTTLTDGSDSDALHIHAIADAHIADVTGDPHAIASDTLTMTNKTLKDFTNLILADGQHIEVRNESGSGMVNGNVVYISGYHVGSNLPEVTLADSSAAATMPALGIVSETIANNGSGRACVTGRMDTQDTSAFSAGDDIYVSETAGALSTKPTGTALVQKLGIVLRSHATLGVLEIIGAGRSNDTPNLADTKLWIGDTNGVPQEFTLSGDVTNTAGGVVAISSDVIINADVKSDAAIAISKTALVAGTNITLSTNTLNVDDAFLKNDAADIGVGLSLTGDNSSADTTYVPNVLYNTDATPPTASTTPIGTIYIQYTA